MIVILYSIIVLLATIFGAIAGLGGGVIIKPLFDMIGFHDASTIGFYSSVAVFVMCNISIFKQLKKGFSFDFKIIIYISLGSLLGGLVGENILGYVTSSLDNDIVKIIQAFLLGVTLILILIYTLNKEKIKRYHIKNKAFIFLTGLGLGCLSVFLGIGGGPLNVATIMLFFSLDIREATIYSIATIFFSQLSKLSQIIITKEILVYDLSFIPFLAISAIIGGYIGTSINQKLDNKKIEKIYISLIIFLIGISCYNIINHL